MYNLSGVPGSDLLNLAATAIRLTQVIYYSFITRELNAVGEEISAYADPVIVEGSFQAVARNLEEHQGLEYQATYANFFTSNNSKDVQRGTAGDRFIYGGDTYECLSVTPWYGIDGWVKIACVRVGPAQDSPYVNREGDFHVR